MKETRFKDTEIGRIPEDWEVIKLGDSFEFKNGLNASKECFGSGTPIINYTDVYKHTSLKAEWIKGRVNLSAKDIDRFRVKRNDVFFTRTSETPEEVGLPSVLLDTINDCVFSGFVLRARPINKFYVPEYCAFCFRTNQIRLAIINSCTYTTRALTNGKVLSSIPTPIPPLSEQTRIASALTSIDNLISSLDKLIEKKKAIKEGTMQQLLTGKKRLKGFNDPWVEKELGKIGDTYSGLTGKTKDDFGVGNAHYITFLNILNNPVLDTSIFEKVRVVENEKQNDALKGDLFFNTSSETPEEVGICSMLDDDIPSLYLNSFCFGYRLSDKQISPKYLVYYFRCSKGRKLMTLLAQGVTRYNMSKTAFNTAKIVIPSCLDEQIKIVHILTSMDLEIQSLEAKRNKYIMAKQGMMQQLLTGKIRLV